MSEIDRIFPIIVGVFGLCMFVGLASTGNRRRMVTKSHRRRLVGLAALLRCATLALPALDPYAPWLWVLLLATGLWASIQQRSAGRTTRVPLYHRNRSTRVFAQQVPR